LLDCKVETCRALGEAAPRSVDHLCAACQEHWDKLQEYLRAEGIAYRVDHRLVRGLDYYTRTVFEIQPVVEGAQSTICGGGRYDGLIEQLGGPSTPGIGFGSGIERLILNLKRNEVPVPDEPTPQYLVVNVGEAARLPALELASKIKRAGGGAILGNGSRALRGQMRQANALGIPYVLVLGDEEIQRGEVVVRNMADSTQETRRMSEFLDSLPDMA
jgi:histidyl-tRNA synthetase